MSFAGLSGLAFLISLAVAWLAREVANRRGVLDTPNVRSSHHIPVPRVGGVGIWAPCLALVSLLLLVDYINQTDTRVAWAVILGAAVLALTGLADDLRSGGLSPRLKYAGQLGGALLTLYLAQEVLVPGLREHWPLAVFALLFQALWLTAFSNFVNFMDGADGLVAGMGVLIFVGFAILGGSQWGSVALIGTVGAGASLGFLFFNRPPATIFMGDSGSLFLGFVWGALGLRLSLWSGGQFHGSGGQSLGAHAQALALVCILLAPIWVDAVTTLLWRAALRKRLSEAHRDHLYQRILRAGSSHSTVSRLYWGYAACCVGAALVAGAWPALGLGAGAFLVLLGIAAVLTLHRLGWAVRP